MSNEELAKLFSNFYNDYLSYNLTGIDNRLAELRRSMEKEHEDLKIRVIEAETKLKLYEAIFNKLNLNIDIKVGGEE